MINCNSGTSSRRLIGVLSLLLGLSLLSCFYYFMMIDHQVPAHPFPKPPNASLKLEVNDFKLQSYMASRMQLQIESDRFVVKKKKIGFLSFGLLNEGILENARLKIYRIKSPIQDNNINKQQGDAFLDDQEPVIQTGLNETIFLNLPVKNIISILAKPVLLELYDDSTLVSTIRASKAWLRQEGKEIVFEGQAHVTSEGKEITADKIVFVMENSTLQIKGRSEIDGIKGKWDGEPLQADVYLNNITAF